MEFDRSTLVVGVHVVVGSLFVAVALLSATSGAALGGVVIRALVGVLVILLGVYVGRTL
ncbi:MAG: hypothetical protein V5A44_05505 [Haloarculaceae archaeon]